MQDREKVIKALECRKNADKRCGNPCEESGMCHYATAIRGLDGDIYKPFICDRERICADALALLKEQEVRVMKLDELTGIYVEFKGDICPVRLTNFDLQKIIMYAENGSCRLWTSRPTNEQMEAVKWK